MGVMSADRGGHVKPSRHGVVTRHYRRNQQNLRQRITCNPPATTKPEGASAVTKTTPPTLANKQ